jgi:hypothetical protein
MVLGLARFKNYEPFEGEDTKFIDYLSELNKLLINDDSTQAIEILKDKLIKNTVVKTSDGWYRIPGDDNDDDDAPRFIPPNQGGKKRRQTKKQRVMKSKKVRRAKKSNKKSKKVKRRSNKRKA